MNDQDTQRRLIWILGLHHSGTTIFWRAFRKNRRFLCFDEPLTENLGAWFPANNDKRTFDEYLRLFGHDPVQFWRAFTPVTPLQELDSAFTPEQIRYLKLLVGSASNVVIDETHVHLHLSALAGLADHANVVHLYRRASGFVTSHMRPSWSTDTSLLRRVVRQMRHKYNEANFWVRSDILPDMRRGDVIGHHRHSKFGLMLSNAGYDAERIMTAPAVVRLLAYWHYHYHFLEVEGPRLFGDRYRTVRYETFATQPREVMEELYAWVGMRPPENVNYRDVHVPRPPFGANDKRWREAARMAGFTSEELETLL